MMKSFQALLKYFNHPFKLLNSNSTLFQYDHLNMLYLPFYTFKKTWASKIS